MKGTYVSDESLMALVTKKEVLELVNAIEKIEQSLDNHQGAVEGIIERISVRNYRTSVAGAIFGFVLIVPIILILVIVWDFI